MSDLLQQTFDNKEIEVSVPLLLPPHRVSLLDKWNQEVRLADIGITIPNSSAQKVVLIPHGQNARCHSAGATDIRIIPSPRLKWHETTITLSSQTKLTPLQCHGESLWWIGRVIVSGSPKSLSALRYVKFHNNRGWQGNSRRSALHPSLLRPLPECSFWSSNFFLLSYDNTFATSEQINLPYKSRLILALVGIFNRGRNGQLWDCNEPFECWFITSWHIHWSMRLLEQQVHTL